MEATIFTGWIYDDRVDFGHLEASDFEIEFELHLRQSLKLLREQTVVPFGDFAQPVVGDHKCQLLVLRQVLQSNHRHLGNSQQPAGRKATVTRYDLRIWAD